MKNKMRNKKYFYGLKNSDLVSLQGLGYREYMLLLEWDSDVWSYFQPEMEILLSAGKSLKIDFWVVRNGVTEWIHLYSGENLDIDLINESHEQAKRFKSILHPIKIDDFINCQKLRNIQDLWEFAGKNIGTLSVSLMLNFIKRHIPNTIRNLKQIFEINGLDKNLVFSMIFAKILIIDIDQPIAGETSFQLNSDFQYAKYAKGKAGRRKIL